MSGQWLGNRRGDCRQGGAGRSSNGNSGLPQLAVTHCKHIVAEDDALRREATETGRPLCREAGLSRPPATPTNSLRPGSTASVFCKDSVPRNRFIDGSPVNFTATQGRIYGSTSH